MGAVTVVGETALHLGPGAAAMSLVAEVLVCAGLHHGVWKGTARRGAPGQLTLNSYDAMGVGAHLETYRARKQTERSSIRCSAVSVRPCVSVRAFS